MKNFRGKIIDAAAPTEQAEIEGLKRYGWSDEEIASMTPAQRRHEFQEAVESEEFLPKQGADHAATAPGGEVPPERGSATPGGTEPSPSAGAAPTEQTEIEALKHYGWSDEEIADMSPAQRRREFQYAMGNGQSEPAAEAAPRRENHLKPVEGAPRTRPTKELSRKLIYGALGVTFLYAIFNVAFEQRETPQVIPGWDGISSCSFMVSFDGKRRLWLSENNFARIDGANGPSTDGSWSFDESTRKYTIAVPEPVVYSAIAPGEGNDCMLIRGELETADLHRSWFYSRADLDDQSDNEPPER